MTGGIGNPVAEGRRRRHRLGRLHHRQKSPSQAGQAHRADLAHHAVHRRTRRQHHYGGAGQGPRRRAPYPQPCNVPDDQTSYEESGWKNYYFAPMQRYFMTMTNMAAVVERAKKAAKKSSRKTTVKSAAKKGTTKKKQKAKKAATKKSAKPQKLRKKRRSDLSQR